MGFANEISQLQAVISALQEAKSKVEQEFRDMTRNFTQTLADAQKSQERAASEKAEAA